MHLPSKHDALDFISGQRRLDTASIEGSDEPPTPWIFLGFQWSPVTGQPDLGPQDHFKGGLVEDFFADLHLSWPIDSSQDRGITWGKEGGLVRSVLHLALISSALSALSGEVPSSWHFCEDQVTVAHRSRRP